MTSPNGEIYQGNWKQNEYHGHGTKIWSNGNRYDGEWWQGRQHGQGLLTVKKQDGTEVFQYGNWIDGIHKEWTSPAPNGVDIVI